MSTDVTSDVQDTSTDNLQTSSSEVPGDSSVQDLDNRGASEDGGELVDPRPAIKMNSKYAAMFGGDDDPAPRPKAKVSAQKRSRSSAGQASVKSLSSNTSTGPHSKGRRRVRKQAGFGMSMPRAVYRTLPNRGFGLQQGTLADYH